MKRMLQLCALAVSFVCVAPAAWGFCQATTCNPSDLTQHCKRDTSTQCLTSGAPLHWMSDCVTVSVQSDGAPQAGIDYETAQAAVERAFLAWTEVDCNGQKPSIRVEVSNPVSCDLSEYSGDHHNANIVMFREDDWPYVGGEDALGLTTLRFDSETVTGEVWDADIEINAVMEPLSTGEPKANEVDLDSVLTHEAGHLLGLGHTLESDATMLAGYTYGSDALRTLASDDVSGICAIYPAERPPSTSSCEPRHGFSELCNADQPPDPDPMPDPLPPDDDTGSGNSKGCSVAKLPSSGTAGAWLVTILLGSGFVRRRKSSARRGWLFGAGATLVSVAGCSRLTSVDWTLIKATESGGTSSSSSGGEGEEGGAQGGNDEGGQAGVDEGGAGGEAGAESGAGTSGAGGNAGNGGNASGGSGGGGMDGGGNGGGGSGGGGTGGGNGGSGGGGEVVIIGGAGAIAQALVLYDGGADNPTANYGGRQPLDAQCQAAKGALPHANTTAFISVAEGDDIIGFPTNHQLPTDKPIVSRTGVILAQTWSSFVGVPGASSAQLRASLKDAGVVDASAKRWISGSATSGALDAIHTCNGWTLPDYDTVIQARFGSVSARNETWLSYLFVACNKGENHVLCLAWP